MSQCPKCKRNYSRNVAMCGFCGLEAPVAEFFLSQETYDKWNQEIPPEAPPAPAATATPATPVSTPDGPTGTTAVTLFGTITLEPSDMEIIRYHIAKGNFNQCIGIINTNILKQPGNLELTFYHMLCLNEIIYTTHPASAPGGNVTFKGNLRKSLFCDTDCKNIMINMSKNEYKYMKNIQYIENERLKKLKKG